MKEIVDVIVVILFVFILFVIIAGFNRQMVEKNRERKETALKREAKRVEELEKNNATEEEDDKR